MNIKHDLIYGGELIDLLQPLELHTHKWTAEATGEITSDVTVNTALAIYLIFGIYLGLLWIIANSLG